MFIHEVNGPDRGRWLHISVPEGAESLYEHPFSREFLEKHLDDTHALNRAVANDLLSLKQPILSKGGKSTVSYGGEHRVTCTDYRIDQTWQVICRLD